jgi:hypothetical protein
MEENESLRTSTRQRPILLQDDRKEKRSHPSSNQVGNHKRFRVSQPEIDQIPDISSMRSFTSSVPNEDSEIFPTQAYTDPTESPPTPVPNQEPEYSPVLQADAGLEELLPAGSTESPPTPLPNQVPDCSPVLQADEESLPSGALTSARQSSRIAERTRQMRWGNSHLRNKSPGSGCCGDGHWSEDEEDVNDHEAEGEKDRDDDEEDRDDDEDEDNDESDVTGISAWDLFGDSFEREATSIRMSLAHESSFLLTIV